MSDLKSLLAKTNKTFSISLELALINEQKGEIVKEYINRFPKSINKHDVQQIVLKGAEKLLIALAYNRPLDNQLIIEDKFTVVSILIHRHSEGLLKLLPILGLILKNKY